MNEKNQYRIRIYFKVKLNKTLDREFQLTKRNLGWIRIYFKLNKIKSRILNNMEIRKKKKEEKNILMSRKRTKKQDCLRLFAF